MPRTYRGATPNALVQHPASAVWIIVERGVSTNQLDDVDLAVLGAEWSDDKTTPAPAPAKPANPKDGD